MKKLRYPGDGVIYITIAALMLFSFTVPLLHSGSEDAQYVVLTYDNTVCRYPLSQDATFSVTTNDGHTLTICIQLGTVSVTDADCPDHICERTAAISRPGTAIACVPAGILIEITGKGGDSDADIVLG